MVYTVDGTMPGTILYIPPLLYLWKYDAGIATYFRPKNWAGQESLMSWERENEACSSQKIGGRVELQRISGKYYYVTDLVDVWIGKKPIIVPGFHLDVPPD